MSGRQRLWRLREPSAEVVADFLRGARREELSWPFPGWTRSIGRTAAGFDHDVNERVLGRGADVFLRAAEALERWDMFPRPWARIEPSGAPVADDGCVAMVAHAAGLWWMNAARIVFVDRTARSRRFAYATLRSHVECGEECFSVTWLADDRVVYRIEAFSRPRHPWVRLAYPVTRRLQRRFVRESMERMARRVAE